MDDYYGILGLDPGASSEQVRQAYRDMARVWHPDRFAHDPRLQQKAQEKLKEINEAYERLQDNGSSASQTRTRSEGSNPHGQTRSEPSESWSGPVIPVEEPVPVQRKSRSSVAWYLLVLLLLIITGLIIRGRTNRSPIPTNGESNSANVRQTSKPEPSNLQANATSAPSPNPAPEQSSGTPEAQVNPYLIPIEQPTPYSQAEVIKDPSPNIKTPDSAVMQPQLPNGESFTVGSTKDQVLGVQGTPDSFSENEYRYGSSHVYFRNGRVVGWYNGYPKLKAILAPAYSSSNDYFTVESTKDEVLSIEGTPDSFSDNDFRYGSSHVYFSNGRVTGWYVGYPKLKVKLQSSAASRDYFTVGSTKDEVVAIQGTPDSFSENDFRYGSSHVYFESGRVVNWYNGYPKLQVRLYRAPEK